jgi:hypothetical protein
MKKPFIILTLGLGLLSFQPLFTRAQAILDATASVNFLSTDRGTENRKVGVRSGFLVETPVFNNLSLTNGVILDFARKRNHESCWGVDTCGTSCKWNQSSNDCFLALGCEKYNLLFMNYTLPILLGYHFQRMPLAIKTGVNLMNNIRVFAGKNNYYTDINQYLRRIYFSFMVQYQVSDKLGLYFSSDAYIKGYRSNLFFLNLGFNYQVLDFENKKNM